MPDVDITDETTLQRVDGVVGADASGMHVLLNDDLRYLGLEQVGVRVWELLEQPCTFGELVAALVTEYDVSPSQCRGDVAPFLTKLIEHRLVSAR